MSFIFRSTCENICQYHETGVRSGCRKIVDKTNLMIQKAQKNITESILYMEETMTNTVYPTILMEDTMTC